MNLEELRRLEAEATPGFWHVAIPDKQTIRTKDAPSGYYMAPGDSVRERQCNAALIVAMRNALPELLKEINRSSKMQSAFEWLEKERERLQQRVAELEARLDLCSQECVDINGVGTGANPAGE